MKMSIERVQESLEAYLQRLREPATNGGRCRRRGMSLLEVMVVIAIILTLMSVLAFGVLSVFADSQGQTTLLTMGKVHERVEIYQLRKKKPPSQSEGLAAVYTDGKLPEDAWGNALGYASPGGNGQAFDLISFGPDGVEGGGDDLIWSEQ